MEASVRTFKQVDVIYAHREMTSGLGVLNDGTLVVAVRHFEGLSHLAVNEHPRAAQ